MIDNLGFFLNGTKSEREDAGRTKKRGSLSVRLEKDLQQHDLPKAISRLEGAMQCNPLDKALTNLLAHLYFQNHELIKAGKHWYLKAEKGENELLAIKAFSRSLGNDPILILKKLINKQFYRLHLLDDLQLEALKDLLEKVKAKDEHLPKFLRSLDRHIDKREMKQKC